MHFTRSSAVRESADALSRRSETADNALEQVQYMEPYGLGLRDFDRRRWADYLGCSTADEAAQNMLDMVLDDVSLSQGRYDLGPRALATAVMRIVTSMDPMQRLTPDRRYLSKPQAQALAEAVLTELGVVRLTGPLALLASRSRCSVPVASMEAGGGPRVALALPVLTTSSALLGRGAPKRAGPAESATFELIPSLLAVHRPLSLPTRVALASLSAGARLGASVLGFREARVSTEWGRWHFFLAGPTAPARPPIAVVHGMFVTASSMLLFACALAAALPDRLIVVPDLLGFDFSYSRPDRSRELPSSQEQVQALATALVALKRAGFASSSRDFRPQSEPGAAGSASSATPSAAPAAASEFGDGDASSEAATRGRAVEAWARECGAVYDLVGHSFGGWVSEELACSYPALVHRLLLLCPAGRSRYRRFRSEVLVMGGPKPMAAALRKHMPVPLAALATTVMTDIARSSGVVRQLLSLGAFPEFFRRPPRPPPHEALLLWGTHEDLHVPYWGVHRAGQPPCLPHGRGPSAHTPGSTDVRHDAAAIPAAFACASATRAAGEALDAPVHMLRDLPNGRGFWVERCNHAIQMEATHTCAWLASRFFNGGHAALPAPRGGSAVRMVADDPLPAAGAPAAVRAVCEALRLSTSAVFRVMQTREQREACADEAASERESKL